jgi:PleD family two-component response regulator
VSGSFGIVDWLPGMSADCLLIAADEALYLAKERGRNQVQIGGPGKGQAKDQGRTESKVTS